MPKSVIGRFALFAALVLAFAYIAVPREGNSDGDGEWQPRPGAQRLASAQSNQNGAWFGGDHTLSRQSDGHFYASTSVNGMPVQMLVDTGASVIALTGADAQAAGIYWDESEVRPVGRGASGTVYGVPKRLDEVAIGDLSQRNVEAIIVPRGLDISLLGQSYLSRLGRVDISGNTMELSAN